MVDKGLAGLPSSIRAANPGAVAPIINNTAAARHIIRIPLWFFKKAISFFPRLYHFVKLGQIGKIT
jgi:hypothetical protein